MILSKAAIHILNQLAELVKQIQESDFSRPSQALSKSTIGQHIRHTLEFFLCLEAGFSRGIINYDKRGHDKQIETDKALAIDAIGQVMQFVSRLKPDHPLTLEVGYDPLDEEYVSVGTNSTRELVYNVEHAVHHMAIIKIGVREIAPYVVLPPDFGIAASTMRYNSVARAVASGS
ncbi:MAG: DinB family protein [Chryseosolibacter sp.]